MKLNWLQLEIMNKASVSVLEESKIFGLVINDGKIVGRLDEDEDVEGR